MPLQTGGCCVGTPACLGFPAHSPSSAPARGRLPTEPRSPWGLPAAPEQLPWAGWGQCLGPLGPRACTEARALTAGPGGGDLRFCAGTFSVPRLRGLVC